MFICLIVGISIVLFFCNLVAKPSQRTGVPYPVICRSVFGVLGANIPAIIRGTLIGSALGILPGGGALLRRFIVETLHHHAADDFDAPRRAGILSR